MSEKMRKEVPWAGWSKVAPVGAERTKMFKDCGEKCFLGTKTPGDKAHPDFPICAKDTCDVDTKGVYAAYVRAKEWGNKPSSYMGQAKPRMEQSYYDDIADKAKKMLEEKGAFVGGRRRGGKKTRGGRRCGGKRTRVGGRKTRGGRKIRGGRKTRGGRRGGTRRR